MHPIIDLRSDTVTRPTPEMRRAMAEAEVGDDVLGDDPTVQRLEEIAAAKVGKEAALFTPTGTMSNNIAIHVLTRPGDEILLDWDAHSMCYEVGAPAIISGVQTRPFRSHKGVPDPQDIADSIGAEDLHRPGTTLLVLENTHNRAGGAVIPLDVHRALYALAKEHGLSVHIDGARIFNAAVASGLPASEYAAQADTVCFSLSKGLGCPAGSMLCGTREFVVKARRIRKRLGGGMRQIGVLAACGIVALETGIDRLAEDHAHARRLATALDGLQGIRVEADSVQTNMVYFDTERPATEWVDRWKGRELLCLPVGAHRIRLVTHRDVDGEDVDAAIRIFRETATALS